MPQDPKLTPEPIPSKSQRKRDAHALFDLGRELVRLKASQLARMPLDTRLREAVEEARAIKSHIAHKRQLQYVARVLRSVDVDPIRAALDSMQAGARLATAQLHRVEAWRDRLLEEGDPALQELLSHHESNEAQALRQLLRNTQREAKLGKPPASARKLFRLLRELDARQPLPPA